MGLVPAQLKKVIGAIRFDWCPPLASMKNIRLPEGDLRPRHTAYMGLVPALLKTFSVPFALIGVPHWPLPKTYAYQRGPSALDTLPTWGLPKAKPKAYTAAVRWASHGSLGGPKSMWGLCGVYVGSMWESMWGPRVYVGSMWDLCGVYVALCAPILA